MYFTRLDFRQGLFIICFCTSFEFLRQVFQVHFQQANENFHSEFLTKVPVSLAINVATSRENGPYGRCAKTWICLHVWDVHLDHFQMLLNIHEVRVQSQDSRVTHMRMPIYQLGLGAYFSHYKSNYGCLVFTITMF